MFVTFEGPDGAGKSTQIRLLADALERRGYEVVATREPGGTEVGDRIRALLLDADGEMAAETEAYLMAAARAEHVREVIRPALDRGAVVLCDRFVDSTLAYQGGGRGLGLDQLQSLQDLAVGDTMPDLTLLLDIDTELGLLRKQSGQRMNRLDRASLDFHQRVAEWYRCTARRCPERWRVIDATQPPGIVHTAVLECVLAGLAEARGVATER